MVKETDSKIITEKDSDRYMFGINGLQLSFYFKDGINAENRIIAILNTIKDFIIYFYGLNDTQENPYLYQYVGKNNSEMNICMDNDKKIGLQFSYESVDFFTEISLEELNKISDFLEKYQYEEAVYEDE